MTQHDFHIALVLLALITVGTLGYQSLNAESASLTGNSTLALYFSSYDGCKGSDAIEILPPPCLNERLHSTIKSEEISFYELDSTMPDYNHYRRTGWSVDFSASSLKFESASIKEIDSISFLMSDVHGKFIKQVKTVKRKR